MASSERLVTRLVIVAAIAGTAFLCGLVFLLLEPAPDQPVGDFATERRVMPLDAIAIDTGATTVPSSPLSGESIVNTRCVACHGSGVSGAPRLGNRTDWADRIKPGLDAMTQIALAGKGAMPPKGGFSDLTDAQIRDAVRIMANGAGADFPAPPAEATPLPTPDSARTLPSPS